MGGMDTIILRTDGSIGCEGRIVERDALPFLPFKMELEEGYTLRSWFNMLHKYPLLTELSFFFTDYLRRFSESPQRGCVTKDFGHLEFSKTVEMRGFPGRPHLEIYNSLKGISGTMACDLRNYRLENILDMDLQLGKLKHIVFGDQVDVFEFETVFTLFEFIDGIAWILSFQTGSIECQLRR